MSHKGDSNCIFSTIKACEAAKRLEMGKCVSMTGEDTQCDNWGIERIDDKAYCGQHVTSVYLKADRERRAAVHKALLDEKVTTYLAWRAEHPSVWDTLRGNECD